MNYSEELLKSVQNKSLDFMIEIDNYFRDHDIDYMICAGTALGAVRHGGFIPWDDDVDFIMHIDDLRKFAKVCKKDDLFNKKFFLQNKWTDPNVPEQFWRIRMNGTTMMDKEGLDISMHWGLPIDLFAIYNAPKNRTIRKLMLFCNRKMRQYSVYSFNHPRSSALMKSIRILLYKSYYYIMLLISKIYNGSDYVLDPTSHGSVEKRFYKREVFYPIQRIEFEDHFFQCPNNLDEYLKTQYGDYMTPPPEEKRVGHCCYRVDMDNDYSKYVQY